MARYEYRRFEVSPRVRMKIRSDYEEGGHHQSKDVYLVDPERPEVNLKVRDGQLDVKQLADTDRGLQQWVPGGSYPLPLDAAVQESWFPEVEGDDLVEAARAAGYRVRTVIKSRIFFQRDDVMGELTALMVAGSTGATLALESESSDALFAAVSELGLEAKDNQSYVDWILED